MDSESSDNIFVFEQKDLLIQGVPVLQELRKRGLFCDVVLKTGNHEFPANRNILAATIPYFYTMFTSEYVESKQREIIIKDIDASSLEALIDFSYSGKIKIDPQNAQKLMKVADFVGLDKVKIACADYLTHKIEADNVFEIKDLANLLNCQQLVSVADDFINANFSKIAELNDFLILELKKLKELIENDNITCSEEEVFGAAMKWVKHNEAERKSHLYEILSKVRLSLVSTEYLVNVVSREKLIMSSLGCLLIVDKAKTYHLTQWENKLTKKSRTLPKLSKLVPILHKTQLKIYNTIINEWLNDIPLNSSRSGFAIATMENKIYVIGGNGSNESNVDIYDLKTRKWTKGKNMIDGRYNFRATTLNDSIYVCGGYQGNNDLSNVECYSVRENNWRAVAPMNRNRYHAGVTSLNGHIYVIGGRHFKQGRLNSCEKYDPSSNTWAMIKSLKCTRSGPSVVTLNNKIYACGGRDDNDYLNSCEVYDPSTDTWTLVASMNEKRSLFALKSINGKLYAVGNGFNDNDTPSVEIYSPQTNLWEMLTEN